MRVLVAEDDSMVRTLLERKLAKCGYDVITAENGRLAWEILQAEPNVDLLITDWVMPEMEGPELCQLARQLKRDRYLPIVLLTARAERDDLIEGLDAGADAFLRKPLNTSELQAHIRVLERIAAQEEQLARQLTALRAAHERLEVDLRAAAEVQHSLLPVHAPEVAGVEFAWDYRACEMVAGDMFNVFRLDEDRIGVYVLDVSGHGVQAALLSVSLSRVLPPYRQRGGIWKQASGSRRGREVIAPRAIAAELNRRFPVLQQSGQYATLLYGILDLPGYMLHYARAGHPGPILIRNGEAIAHDERGGPAIGMFDEAYYDECQLQLQPGDMVVFLTDGVYEMVNPEDQQLGAERVLRVLGDNSSLGIKVTIGALSTLITEFSAGARQQDDITIVGFGLT
jgi:phosphoserine phosphatase RsbU/P